MIELQLRNKSVSPKNHDWEMLGISQVGWKVIYRGRVGSLRFLSLNFARAEV
ncbi:MAG: hypothetical protein ACLQLC_03840 [Candidatus Sulfotelmatobacter sp.]